MNTTLRAGWLTVSLLFTALALTAQSSVQENLSRADKQFDLYAYNLALRTYEQVIKEQPTNAHALARMGDCYFQLNRPQDALSWYDRAVVLGNAAPETLFNYGKALLYTADYIGAKKWFILYSGQNRTAGQQYAAICDFALQAGQKESMYLVLNEPLNTNAADYSPVFYESKIVYSSARSDIKRQTASKSNSDWTGSAYNQMYVTQRNAGDGYLQQPTFLRGDLQNNFNEGPVSFSADGRRVAYCRNNFIDGTRQIAKKGVNMSLYVADVVNGAWANERAFPYNGSDYATGFPCLSADGNTLYFASNQDGGVGGWDIYVSNWTNGNWTIPRNLGSPLNTPGDEVTPYFDGENLYFSSDWHKGLGGLDVFRAAIQNNFIGEIVHLGTGINSSRDDYGFVYDSRTSIGYLTSTRPEGRGNEDIWQVRKRVDEFVITVTDPQRNPIADAEIDFSACNAGTKTTDASGRYSFAVATGKADCRVTVRKPGYQSTVVPIQSKGDKTLSAVLMPEYGTASAPPPAVSQPATYGTYNNNLSPTTYNTPGYDVENGMVQQFTVYVSDEMGRALPGAELNLNACGLGTIYTDMTGRGSFYFPQGGNCNLLIRKNGLADVLVPLNQQSSREMSIAMNADQRTKYSGLVLSADTRRPIQDVVVTARSRQGNHETLAYSSVTGQYTLLLRSYQTYDISYIKVGYLNFVSSLQTERALQVDMELSPITLAPNRASTATAGLSPVMHSTQPTSGGMISLADLEELAATSSPYTPPPSQPQVDNTPIRNPISTIPAPKVEAYAIQLSANPNTYSSDQTRKYDALTGHGNLYSVKEGNLYKLRLGVYPTRDEANDILKNAVVPYVKDAFVVVEDQANANMLVGSSGSIQGNSLAAKGGTTPVNSANTGIRFAVQVASWPNTSSVLVSDYANLAQLGYVYIQPESDRLRVRVGTWGAYEQAEVARAQAIQLGYRDALIITEKQADLTNEKLLAAPGSTTPKGNLTAAPATYSVPSGVAPTSTTTDNAKYYVRVCAMDDPYNFDPRKIDGTGGIIEKWPIGSTTKTAIMLTGFPSVGQAMLATDKLRTTGFRDAYIIKDENGRMSKYRY